MEHAPHHAHHGDHSLALADLLDLDGEVSQQFVADVTAWFGELAGFVPTRIVDLGAGTGTWTLALATSFDAAELLAVDRSEEMLRRLRAKAELLGFADRVRTIAADVDVAWPALEPVDVVWAALVLHELADPGRALGDAFAGIRSGGLLVAVEMDAPPTLLLDDLGLGAPGLEARIAAARRGSPADRDGHPDWGPLLEAVGFTGVARRSFTIELPPPHPAAVGRYANAYLSRLRPSIEGQLAPADLDALDILLAGDGPDSVLHRTDLIVRGTRAVWVARRP